VRWLKSSNRDRWECLNKAVEFFKQCLDANSPRVVVENPIPHKYALKGIGRRYDQIIHPWQYGHAESKGTCLWLKGLPLLEPTNVVEVRQQRVFRMPPMPNLKGMRERLRSITYEGIAKAMAEQWG
jgi:hypothetical protein